MNNNKNTHPENINDLKQTLKELIKKKNDIKLRTQANIENIKKKYEDTIIQIKKENLKNFQQELTSIVEQIDQINQISDQPKSNQNSIIEGIKLIQKSILHSLKKIK